MQKLQRVNEKPNPHVVRILNHGLTTTGSFPFIEMEYIDGPDLEELLKPPHDSIFTVRETIKVAEHLASALMHCHRLDVKHGDIKSNNVKFDRRTGNYLLLDFGLAVLSDEQRRTSLRRAGAVEFMAPEQTDGMLLMQSDVYGFGVILFELLAGVVPFPLTNNTETARNHVLLAHQEAALPDILSLRKEHLPLNWSEAQKAREVQVPDWLLDVIYKCLQKEPQERFPNGIKLLETICDHSVVPLTGIASVSTERSVLLEKENERLLQENKELKERLQTQSERPFASNTQPQSKATLSAIKRPFRLKTLLLGGVGLILLIFLISRFSRDKADQTPSASKPVTTASDKNRTGAGQPTSADTENQLKEARTLLEEGRLVDALELYDDLSDKGVPEAMFHFGNLALQNRNDRIGCRKGYELVKKASDKGYTPAKRTLGFLFVYGEDPITLEQNGYTVCRYKSARQKGAGLLLVAALEGDEEAKRLLQVLNKERLQ